MVAKEAEDGELGPRLNPHRAVASSFVPIRV